MIVTQKHQQKKTVKSNTSLLETLPLLQRQIHLEPGEYWVRNKLGAVESDKVMGPRGKKRKDEDA